MKIIVSPTPVQPSSTTLRYFFKLRNGEYYVHDELPSIKDSLRIIDLLRRNDLVKWESYEGSIGSLDAGAPTIDIDYGYPDTYLIIVDPGVGCPMKCPWCYEGPVPYKKKEIDVERLATNVTNVIREIARNARRKDTFHTVSVVFGGSTDPSFSPSITSMFYEILTDLLERKLNGEYNKGSMYIPHHVEVYYTLSTSNPMATYDTPLYEIVLTYITPEFLGIHPRFRELEEAYYDMVDDYPRRVGKIVKELSLSIIVHEDTDVYDIDIPPGFNKVFLLHYHPSNPRLSFKPPSKKTILDVMEYIIDKHGLPINRINVDACSMIKLGVNKNWVHYAETHNMIRCTHIGCRYAKICPRGGNKCVADQ